MLKWLITLALALFVISWFTPWLRRNGLGRLPGDFSVKLGKRQVFIPLTSTVLLSLLLSLIARLFR